MPALTLKNLEKKHACSPGLDFFISHIQGKNVNPWDTMLEHGFPDYYLWVIGKGFTSKGHPHYQEQVGKAAEKDPFIALRFAAAYLTEEQIVKAAEKDPYTVLQYAAAYLTEEQIGKYAEKVPWVALRCAGAYLTEEQRAKAAKKG